MDLSKKPGTVKIAVASKNGVKLNAVKEAFGAYFDNVEVVPVSVPSGVSDQPTGNMETRLGAQKRVLAMRDLVKKGELVGIDYLVAIEGGVSSLEMNRTCFAYILAHRVQSGRQILCKTLEYAIPKKASELLSQGLELGDAMDKVFNKTNSKQKMGCIGLMSGGAIDRKEVYAFTLKLNLYPFLNPQQY